MTKERYVADEYGQILKDENKQLKDLIILLGYTIKYDDRHISLELKE